MGDKITDAVLDPKWSVGLCMIGEHKVPYFRFDHPKHGEIAILMPERELQALGKSILKMLPE